MKARTLDYVIIVVIAVIFLLAVTAKVALADITPAELQMRVDRSVMVLIQAGEDSNSGSGYILDSGKILTAGHLFSAATTGIVASSVFGYYEAARIPAKLYMDNEIDISILKGFDTAAPGHTPVRCTPPVLDERVFTISYPDGQGPLVLHGRVPNPDDLAAGGSYLVALPMMQPGMSGAPLFDADGKLTGVVVALINFDVGGLGVFVSTADIEELCGGSDSG